MKANEIKDFIKASYSNSPPQIVNGFTFDATISQPTALVYSDGAKAIVVHRGTRGAADWLNNIAYLSGFYPLTNRFKTGESVQREAEAKYGSKNVTTISHSQGSIISRKVGSNSKQIINVNPAWLFEIQQRNEYNIRSRADPISLPYEGYKQVADIFTPKFSEKHNITIEPSKRLNLLEEHRSDILSRISEREIGGSGSSVRPRQKEYSHFHFRYGL